MHPPLIVGLLVWYREGRTSVVRYLPYNGKYRDTERDDTSIAKVTVYRGAKNTVSIVR